MTVWHVIKRCLFGALVIIGLLTGLVLSNPKATAFSATPRIVLYSVLVGFILLTVIFFVTGIFERITSNSAPERFLGWYNLTIFPTMMILIYANIYKDFGLNGRAVEDVWDYLYFSIITWTTTGYGDLVPSSDSRMFAASEALLGYIFMGLYLAVIFHFISVTGNGTRSGSEFVASGPEPLS